jgi:DNA-binding CsgD family transcriptional regulator
MAERGRGHLASAQGDDAGAIDAFDRAIRIFDTELPMPFERARAVLGRGTVRRRVGRRRDAREDIASAHATFDRLGAAAWSRRAAREMARIGGRSAAGPGLTASERIVAELAATGRSNREIAAELVLSVRTVESQLSVAYRKLEITSRSQLRAALEGAEAGAG